MKLFFAAFFAIVTLSVFSQNVITTNTSGPAICDGSAYLDSSNFIISNTSIYWSGNGTIIQQGGLSISGLCAGTYTVTYTQNGAQQTITFIIGSNTTNPCANFSANLNVTNSTDTVSCDGSVTVSTIGGTAPYVYSWNNGSTTSNLSGMCPGQVCLNITDANGCSVTACDSISIFSQNFGDTIVINGGGNCNSTTGSITMSIEDCSLDYNAIDTAYLSNVFMPTPLDSATLYWVLVDTNGVNYTIVTSTMSIPANVNCYNFTLILYCSQKSQNVKTIIVNDNYNFTSSGITELVQDKKIVRIVDLLGRDAIITPNRVFIIHYSDGSTQKIMRVSE